MTLTPGTRIGPYQVTGVLGAGGMGQVYRARDTRLGRDVAVKILLDVFAGDPDLLARFEREARLLASLNHPNIAHIYGLEDAATPTTGSGRALVMELVEGPTLADRIEQGPLPIDETVAIAKQITDALETAHEQGIVHRDLKPANIKIRPDGIVKVLDFGLARLADSTQSFAEISARTTPAMTGAGVVLGTPAYMSPEQARGRAVDARADLWAFGCVCYEMLTGRRAFDGETASDAISAVLTRDPDWSALPEHTPALLRRVIRRCLARDVTRRLRHAGDVRLELEEIGASPPAEEGSRRATAQASRRSLVPWGVAALCALVALWLGWRTWRTGTPAAAPATTRLELSLPPGLELFPSTSHTVVASPDGRSIAFVGTSGSSRQLFLRPLDGFESSPLRGTDGATTASFAPDGRSLVFVTAAGELKTVSLTDGLLTNVTKDASLLYGLAWAADDQIVYTRESTLWMVTKAAGEPRRLTTMAGDERLHAWPSALPDGTVIFTVETGAGPRIEAVTLSTGARTVVLNQATRAMLGPDDLLFFYRDSRLLASAFDASALRATGPPIPVLDTVTDLGGSTPVGHVSPSGLLVFPLTAAERRLVWVSRQGAEQLITDTPRPYLNPRISPDGTRIITQAGPIWIHDLRRKADQQITTVSAAANAFPMWLPDGVSLMHRSGIGLRLQSTDTGGEGWTLPATTEFDYPGAVTGNRETLVFLRSSSETSFDVLSAPLSDPTRVTPVVKTRAYEGGVRLSPDERWIVYVSNESGRNEVYISPFQGPARRWQVSAGGGTQPAWHPNGREVFYRIGERMMAVAVTAIGNELQLSAPTPLFSRAYAYGAGITMANYDVAKDGRFVMVKDDTSIGRLRVVLNWRADAPPAPTR